jgi:hypothetical protein
MVAAALLLALTIVGVAALVNTAAFDDARATQAQSDAPWEGLEYRDEVATGVGGVVRVVNNDSQFASYRDLNDSYRRTTRDWVRLSADHYGIAGRSAGADPQGTVNGTRIAQNVSTDFQAPATSDRNWTVARGINDTRHFRMNVSNDSLRADQGFGAGPRGAYHTSRYFRVNLTQQGGPTRGVYLYRNGAADRVFLRVDGGPSRGISRRCAGSPNPDGRLTIHLTNRRVGDAYCAPLDVFDTVQDTNYTVRYERSDEISGSYDLYVDDNRSEVLDVQRYNTDGSSSPFVENATYAGLTRLDYAAGGVNLDGTIAAIPDDLRPLAGGEPFTPPALTGEFITYRTSGIRSLNRSGNERSYSGGGTGNAGGIGPSGIDVDSDGNDEIPYKKGSDLKIISSGDGPGNTDEDNVIASDQIDRGEQMTYGVDVWDGDGSVFYPRDDGVGGTDALGRAWCDGDCSNTGMVTTQQETITQGDGNGVHSIAGTADLNNDSLRDIVYVDRGTPHAFHFWDNASNTRVDRTSVTVPNTSSTTPPAIGTPADFDGDGFARVPLVNSTGGIQLVNLTAGGVGTTERISPDGTATETTMAVLDWDGDAEPEVVYLEAGTNELRIIDDVTGANTDTLVTDNTGDPISADPEFGVR